MLSNHQIEFDRAYISSSEICKRLKISRAQLLYAKLRSRLPPCITVGDGNGVSIWKRDEAEPMLIAWEQSLRFRRGQYDNINDTISPES